MTGQPCKYCGEEISVWASTCPACRRLWPHGLLPVAPFRAAAERLGLLPRTEFGPDMAAVTRGLGRRAEVLQHARGANGEVFVYEDSIVIRRRGFFPFLIFGFKGDKRLALSAITAVQYRAPGRLLAGYIQFTVPGGIEGRRGLSQAVSDENTVTFGGADQERAFVRVRNFVEARIARPLSPPSQAAHVSVADELMKLDALRKQGVLTDEEFQRQKARLINT